MLTVYTCLTQQHDLRLVLLAGIACLLSALTAFNVIARARQAASERTRNAWLAAAAVTTGFGIWSTHFIAILAFRPGLPMGYAWGLTVASVVIAILITGAGIAASVHWPTRKGTALGGATVGLGIACMHFTGMAALRVPGYITYDPALVAASVVLGIGLGAAAFTVRRRMAGPLGFALATGLLTLAICAMHFTGMASARITVIANAGLPTGILSDGWLAAGIAIATLTITILCLVTTVVDQHLARRALGEAERLSALAEAGTEGIVICSDGIIEYGNSAFSRITGLTAQEMARRPFRDFVSHNDYDHAIRVKEEGGTPFEASLRTKDGDHIPVELFARRMEAGKEIFAMRDLTEQKRSQARIEFLAHHDALTELPNRSLFKTRFQQELAGAARRGEKLAVMCLDLDRFKDVNDTLGHAAGDLLLRQVADRLAAAIRETDVVARLSGDEFAIIQVGISQPEGATQLATRIHTVLSPPVDLDGHETPVGVSIGISVFPDDGTASTVLLRNADMALYRAKAEGRNTHRFFETGMDEAMRQRREIERDLRNSLKNGEMYLEYQPQAMASTNEIVGFEALVRWRHPRRGKLLPGSFIEIAEDCGFIVPLGRWVLHKACSDAARWERPLGIAVNLSPVQFQHGDLYQEVADILAETGLAPERLELEITEGVLLADKDRAVAVLARIKSLGVRIAMDDFGTGYSSLSYLQSFPFDKIKIDRSFVAGLEGNEEARAIVRAVIGLSHALNLPVVAEGVESEAQLDLLRRELCTEVQGYLIGRPGELGTFTDILHTRAAVS
jgi:diguanylate cyclase (GGDEF)-like protein/PAS domain S-box-containing protein